MMRFHFSSTVVFYLTVQMRHMEQPMCRRVLDFLPERKQVVKL